jgi:CheY-like chemotaxis protein
MKKHVLSVSYDQPLLVTRQLILEQAGCVVSSAFGFVEAPEICKTRNDFDLILMGHSMPQKDKIALVEALRQNCMAPLLSMSRDTVMYQSHRPNIQSIPMTVLLRCWPPFAKL